jgi:hypothetical protein
MRHFPELVTFVKNTEPVGNPKRNGLKRPEIWVAISDNIPYVGNNISQY